MSYTLVNLEKQGSHVSIVPKERANTDTSSLGNHLRGRDQDTLSHEFQGSVDDSLTTPLAAKTPAIYTGGTPVIGCLVHRFCPYSFVTQPSQILSQQLVLQNI